jgi:hypothetical protein
MKEKKIAYSEGWEKNALRTALPDLSRRMVLLSIATFALIVNFYP